MVQRGNRLGLAGKRRRNTSSAASAAERTLTATRRRKMASSARNSGRRTRWQSECHSDTGRKYFSDEVVQRAVTPTRLTADRPWPVHVVDGYMRLRDRLLNHRRDRARRQPLVIAYASSSTPATALASLPPSNRSRRMRRRGPATRTSSPSTSRPGYEGELHHQRRPVPVRVVASLNLIEVPTRPGKEIDARSPVQPARSPTAALRWAVTRPHYAWSFRVT